MILSYLKVLQTGCILLQPNTFADLEALSESLFPST